MLYHCRMDRVLEVGGYAAGFCGRLFAQCGAEVAHVEAARSRVGVDLAWRQNHEDRINAAIAAWTRPQAERQAAAKMQAAGVLVDKPPK